MGEEIKLEDNVSYEDYPKSAWSKPSLAVIACDGAGHGAVIWTAGPHLRLELEEYGLYNLDELGLDDAPKGISIWEGRYTYHDSSLPFGPDEGCSSEAHGAFRAPTDEEWKAIHEERCPWEDSDWRKQP